MTAPAQEPEVRRYHDLDFADYAAPLGYARCRQCGQIISRDLWAGIPCPGPARKEEQS